MAYRFFIRNNDLQIFADIMDDAKVHSREEIVGLLETVATCRDLGFMVATQYPEGVEVTSEARPPEAVAEAVGGVTAAHGFNQVMMVAKRFATRAKLAA